MVLNENAKKWVEALRSGKYSQCKGTLQNRAGYCCLGVACDVYEKETGNKLPKNNHGFYKGCSLINKFEVVKDWLGLKEHNGNLSAFLYQGTIYPTLAYLNDHSRSTFNEIANVIEFKGKELFNI